MDVTDLILLASALISLVVIWGACIYSDKRPVQTWEEYQNGQW